jgi:dolichol-phosphate mannosyltransferase
MSQHIVAIPAYNPDGRLLRLVEELRDSFEPFILVVDDGSAEASRDVFASLEEMGLKVLKHEVNKGKGAALKLAASYVLENFPGKGFVAADADGQHKPEDILGVCLEMEKNPDSLILGVRDFSRKGIPMKSKLGNRLASLAFLITTGQRVADTQTGLRGMPASFMEEFSLIQGDRFEFEMNALSTAAKKLGIVQVPIQTIYEDNNKGTHFRAIEDSVMICRCLFSKA